jgi:CelD/BcsL family acetyltransferase involved in cellulose biosynthesis
MSDIQAYSSGDIPAAPSAHANAGVQRAGHGIVVEIADATQLGGIRAAWSDLLTRADAPNVFMDPTLVQVACGIAPKAQHRALLAWKSVAGRRQLVGVWSFAVGRARRSVLPMRALTIPAYEHGYLATPVVDRDYIDETLDAMLDGIVNDARLPKIISLDSMSAEGPVYEALGRVLAKRGSAPCMFARMQRPKLQSDLDGKAYLEKAISGSTRKKLRQNRRKLAEKGILASLVAIEPAAVRAALEEFLSMEASGWKGREGTALLSSAADAAFLRGAVGALADHGCAAIHSLYLDGKPISMQIVVRAGAAAFTWKTAYDETFRDFSPGMLLFEDYTAAFLADQNIAFVDSCSFDDSGYMATWTERQAIADLWIDARRGGSLEFRALGSLQKSYREGRAAAKAVYLKWRKSRKK